MIVFEDQAVIAIFQVLGYGLLDLVVDVDGDEQVIDLWLADLLIE
jgi:hypothetical protein